MVFDVDKLKEVLAQDQWGPDDINEVIAAARLVVAGQPLWWCEAHLNAVVEPDHAPTCYSATAYPSQAPFCRMVEGWWMPTGGNE